MIYTLIAIMVAVLCAGGWKAPKSARDINNPMVKLQGNEKMTTLGKNLYIFNCATCHGESGRGDGSSARFLAKPPTDLSTSEFQSQTDGEIYWKILIGKLPMPTFGEALSEKKIWLIVNYLRTVQK